MTREYLKRHLKRQGWLSKRELVKPGELVKLVKVHVDPSHVNQIDKVDLDFYLLKGLMRDLRS
jgi:hypothetical protein